MWHRDSTYTDQDEAEMLCAALLSIGREARVVETPKAPGWTVEVWIEPIGWTKSIAA
jgi:hypothetical protein